MDSLLTAPEVAEILGVHVNYVWAEAKRGHIHPASSATTSAATTSSAGSTRTAAAASR